MTMSNDAISRLPARRHVTLGIVDEYQDRLRAKLTPQSVMTTLIRAGCFLAAYELIKSEVVEKVHDFFWRGMDNGRDLYDEVEYERSVLSRDPRSKYRASCSWLVQMHALTTDQVGQLEAIYDHRKEVAHELPKLLTDPDFEVKTDLLRDAIECVRCLGVFWGTIEVQIDPQWHDVEIDYDGIKSGPYMLMEYLATIAGLDGHLDETHERNASHEGAND